MSNPQISYNDFRVIKQATLGFIEIMSMDSDGVVPIDISYDVALPFIVQLCAATYVREALASLEGVLIGLREDIQDLKPD